MSAEHPSKDQSPIDGWAVRSDLKNGGKVEVWWPKEPIDDIYHLTFTNQEGAVTKIGLSGEALHATMLLYARALRHQTGEEIQTGWTFAVKLEEVEEKQKP